MEAARGSQGTVEASKCPPSFACQLSAFPGQCPPVVRLLFLCSVFARQFVFPVPCPPVVHLLPTSSPPSPDPAHQLSAFPGPCPPVVCLPPHPARQLSAFPGPCPSVVRLHISELGIQPKSVIHHLNKPPIAHIFVHEICWRSEQGWLRMAGQKSSLSF